MKDTASLKAARFLMRTACATPDRLAYACRAFADDPGVAGAVIGTLGYVIVFESTGAPAAQHGDAIVLEVRHHSDRTVIDIDDVEEYTRAVARIVACLAGGDLPTAGAVVGAFAFDPDRATRLLERMTRYAHAACHSDEPVITFSHVPAALVDIPDHV